MNVAVVGLGLIGGSFCKAIKKYTDHRVFGIDVDEESVRLALDCRAIDAHISAEQLGEMDFTIVCLHPKQTIAFILEQVDQFKCGSLVIDSCGIKTSIMEAVNATLADKEICFVGCHPMAGREFSGFAYALDSLFEGASFIMTPEARTPAYVLEFLKGFAQKLQFKKVVITTAAEHDRVIAFTSQLAHVVSNAYIKSPSLQQCNGFSAGSFLDLTRVAKLNEKMWTDLFMMNQLPLIREIDTIIDHLSAYKQAMLDGNQSRLCELLREGRILKEESLLKKV